MSAGGPRLARGCGPRSGVAGEVKSGHNTNRSGSLTSDYFGKRVARNPVAEVILKGKEMQAPESPARRKDRTMTASTAQTGTPKATAPKAPAKSTTAKAKAAPKPAPAKKAPAPKAAAKSAPAAVAPSTEAPKPTWGARPAGTGKAHLFRLDTLRRAIELGYKDNSEAPFSNVVRFVKGNTVVTVTYSAQDFVRKVVVGDREVIKPDQADKWKRLNAVLADLAKG